MQRLEEDYKKGGEEIETVKQGINKSIRFKYKQVSIYTKQLFS